MTRSLTEIIDEVADDAAEAHSHPGLRIIVSVDRLESWTVNIRSARDDIIRRLNAVIDAFDAENDWEWGPDYQRAALADLVALRDELQGDRKTSTTRRRGTT